MATKRHRCIRFCCSCFSLTNEKEHDHTSAGAQSAPSDEKGHDPTPAGAQSAPSDEKGHDPTPAGAQSAPSDEKAHDPTPAGAQSAPSDEKGHDPTSAGARSSPSAIDSTIENLPGAPKRTEAPISGSNLNVSGAEAQVSESSNVPLISEGENVNANQNVSGPPGCNEAPSSSSSSGAIKSGLLSSIRHTDIAKVDGKYVVDVDKLIEHISDLFKLREEEKHLHQNASIPRNFPWPDVPGLTKLKKILPFGTDLRNLNELLSAGLKCVSDLKDIISGPVKTFLKDIGQVSIVTAGLLVVAYTLERFDDLSTNKEKCWDLLKEMCYVATVVKRLKENSKGTQDVIEEEATALLVEGAIMCCTQIDSSAWKRFFETSKIKADLSDIRQKLNVKYRQINIEIGFRVLSAMESKGRSPLSKKYPKHAVGIDKSITDVLDLLECESEEKAVTVILHGFGGMGKTTLADAVFSQVGGCRYSHVQLFEEIDSKPDIKKLQTDILKDLMEPGEAVPDIRKYEDGQRELGERLEKVHAVIYIDNVLKGDALKKLLPPDMNTAKKVRFLLTARDEHVETACPRSKIKIYKMKGIQHPEAMLILKKEIEEGINGDQFKNIIQICGEIPLMLTLTAPFIGRAKNKKEAYETLMRQKDKWPSEGFNEMRYAFAYDALPDDCKDPLLDICSYFKGWNWDTVEDIVGKEELRMLESRALVTRTTNVVASVHDVILTLGPQMMNARQKSSTRTTNVVASVHDVILTLARQKSEEESKGKELRLTFNSASKLKEFLKEKAEGIKGIWLSDNKDALEISATTLDLMSKSLRVLQLGIFTKVEGKCREIFNKLVFFEAKIDQLPFCDVSKLEQLRYLSYEPNDLTLSKMPSSLRHMEFNGRKHSHVFQISSTDLERLRNLRILRLVNFSKLTNLPERLGDQVSGLQELSLSDCESIEKLPDSISKLQSLQILKMNGCSSLTELSVNFGSLSSLKELNLKGCSSLTELSVNFGSLSSLKELNLQRCSSLTELSVNFGSLSSLKELNLQGCSKLKALPDSVENLSSLTLLDLSLCDDLLNLPPGLGNLTSLVELDLSLCGRLESIPESIGELKQLQVLRMSLLDSLKELPHGFCNLSSITHLSMRHSNLEKLPDGFGQLASLKELDFEYCSRLELLPKGFGQLRNLEVLFLRSCLNLRELCNDFHCLSSLHNLDLSYCKRLEKLPEDFHCLTSLQRLNLSGCCELEGRSMDHMVKMNRLQVVKIEGSKQLVKRWAEIQRDGDGLWSFTVFSEQVLPLSESEKENIENSLLSELDSLLTNGQKEPFRVSDLPPNTLILVIWNFHLYKYNFPWPLIEETIDEMQIEFKIIYIGSDFDELPTKVKDSIFVVDVTPTGALEILQKVCWTLDIWLDGNTWFFQMHTKMLGEKSDKYRPCWRFLREGELEEIVVGNSRRYLRLKQLVETNQKSNIKLLTELFAPEGDETTPVFQKNESSRQDPKEKLEHKTACGVDKLEGKTILLEMRPIKSRKSFYDIRLPSLKAMYELEKENLDLEIISIPLVDPGDEYDALDLYRKFSREVPWFVLQNSWMVMTSVVKFFFAKHCRWEEGEKCEKLYSTINWIIEPNGRIIIYTPSICLKDKGEVFKVLFHYLESESYQVRWGVKASPTMYEKIEKLRKEEWKQLKNMSNLEFLFNHLESAQVKKSMFQGKLICLYTAGEREELTCSIWNAMEHFRDSIYFIYISHNFSKNIGFTKNISKDYSLKIFTENTKKMPLSILSIDETVRFAMRLDHLEEEINGMDESDKQLCELKSLLHSVHGDLHNGSIIFMDERGGMVAAFRGHILESIFLSDRKDRAQQVIKSIMEDFEGGGKEMHDQDPGVSESLIKKMQTAVEQENMDVYLDSLRNYISELRGVELYQLLNVNKEAKKWSRPKVTWPTSRSFCMLKDFLSEGINADWVKDVISRHPEEKDKWKPVIKSLLSGIEEANWAVAGLLAVADVLERFETLSANQIEVWQNDGLFILHAMLRLAQYIGQVNQKPGLWRNIKRVATALILECCSVCCALIDQSKLALFQSGIGVYTLCTIQLDEELIKQCDLIAKAITEGLDESGSLIKQMCAGFGDYLETFCEEESDVSYVKVCL